MKGRTGIDVGSFVPYREVTETVRERTLGDWSRKRLIKRQTTIDLDAFFLKTVSNGDSP